jgi:hypothetical protein
MTVSSSFCLAIDFAGLETHSFDLPFFDMHFWECSQTDDKDYHHFIDNMEVLFVYFRNVHVCYLFYFFCLTKSFTHSDLVIYILSILL